MQTILGIFSFVLGAIFGSFLNVVILRLPLQQTLSGRSKCRYCGEVLKSGDLIPLLSYIFLRGRCRYCQRLISPRYFIIEFVCGLLFCLSWFWFFSSPVVIWPLLIKYWLICLVLVAVFVIDLEHYLILDNIIFPAAFALLVLNGLIQYLYLPPVFWIHSQFITSLFSALGWSLLFFCVWRLSKGQWLGFGDVKFMIFFGLALGWPLSGVGLFLAIIFGGVISVFLLIFADKNLKTKVPFGTFLALGGVTALFFGPQLLGWYLSFLGF